MNRSTPEGAQLRALSPAQVEALHLLREAFGERWKVAMIVNVWMAGDGGACYFDPPTCAALNALQHHEEFDLASFDALLIAEPTGDTKMLQNGKHDPGDSS